MYPLAYASAQRTLRVWFVIGVVVFGSLGIFVGSSVLSSSKPAAGLHSYLVNFTMGNGTETGGSGSAPYLQTTTAKVPIKGENLTNVTFMISWQDNSFSPLTDPSVSVTITGPNGTGTVTKSVPSRGGSLSVPVPNDVPANQTLQASSEADALARAAGNNTNASLGSGDWSVALKVGAPLGGRVRPGGGISYTIAVQVEYFVGSAKQV